MKTTQLLALLILITTLGTAGSGYAGEVSSKEVFQKVFCQDFEAAQDTVDVETLFEKIDASPYASHWQEFWTAPACHASVKTDSLVPIIFNTARMVAQAENYPKAVREYLLEVKQVDETAWLRMINTKSSDGLTFLDYMRHCITHNVYSLQDSKDAAQRVVNYLCQHGGVYSKYKDTVKCP